MFGRKYVSLVCLAGLFCNAAAHAVELTPLEELGKKIFFDTNLSAPAGQACASCHAPQVGFSGPDSKTNLNTAVYSGAIHSRFGNRKPPTAAYGGDSSVLYFDPFEGLWLGGMFFDGRATGWTLGDPLAEQAQKPFLNPLEQNLSDEVLVCAKVALSNYAGLFRKVWGPGSLNFLSNTDLMYERIVRSIAAYERSAEVNPFTSKYDYFLKGKAQLTKQEAQGLELFNGKALCSACHISEPGPNGEPPLFTDFSYDNLGIPKNPNNPFYTMPSQWNPDGADWIDPGLGGFLKNEGFPAEVYEGEWGKHRVSTLRNVDKRPSSTFVKSYGHNGFFKSLKEIVHFYNTRDVEAWAPPEVPQTMNTDELGNLGLTSAEEDAIVAFMRTLSDGYRVNR